MANGRHQSLAGRADQAGLLWAATNAPLTFQRTLMPRSTMDQALVTGLSAAANHALVSLIQESIQAAALVIGGQARRRRVHEGSWGTTSIAADLLAIGTGLVLQKALPQHHREPLERAGARTGGLMLATSGTAGAIVGVLQETFERSGAKRGRSYAIVAPAAACFAAANIWRVRRAAHADADLPPEESQASLAKSVAYGLGIAGAMSAVGAGERKVADKLAQGLARLLPGNEALWRPVGHAASLAALGFGTRFLAEKMLHRIETVQESMDAAFDIAPPDANVSGSYESLVPFDTLSRAGRRYVWTHLTPDVIAAVMGETVTETPIRAYVGLGSADDGESRVELTMRELERTGAFERAWLLVASPTGTGYVNYAAVSIMELLSRGDCATVAVQYSARPSPLSLDRVVDGRRQTRSLMRALRDRLAQIPEGKRPKVVLFGESLGAWTSQDAFVDHGTQGLVDTGVDYAIWIGTPNFSKWKERVLFDDGPEIDRSLIGVFNDIGEWNATPAAERERIRYVMITHYDDGVAMFGPSLAIQAPEWLGPSETRPAPVPKGMRWVPTTTFFQVLVDMKNAANVVPGVFAAKGHDYRADLLPFFHAVLGMKATPEQLEKIAEWLERRELVRSQWMKEHDVAGKSLAATVLTRLIDEERAKGGTPDERLMQVVRSVAFEEFDAGSPGKSRDSTP
ncbi:MAG: alpha/beta-hydrolase family protein [Acidimicrobiia bacterium]